jgi:hypothetical protein
MACTCACVTEAAIAYAPASAIESMRKAQEEISRKVVSRALDVCKQREASTPSQR